VRRIAGSDSDLDVRPRLLCSVNDATNVLPCSTCAYLNGGPFLTCAPFPGRRWLSGRPRLRSWRSGYSGCWPLRTLGSHPWSDIDVAVDGCAVGCPAWRCRQGLTTLPPSRVSAAPGLWLPVSTSRVHCPSVRTVAVRRLRGPGAKPQQVSQNRTLRQCPRAAGRAAGRPLSAADTAAAPPRTLPQPLSRAGTPQPAGSPSIHAHPRAAAVGTGRRLPTLPGVRGASGTAATWRCRPDGLMAAAARVSGRLRNGTLQASAVHRCVRNHSRGPDGRCPAGTLPQAAGVGCYRNRSSARRPLDGCRHRR
jgi:hypothetical protein